MERNIGLAKSKDFKYADHFRSHLNALLVNLYDDAIIEGCIITFTDQTHKGIRFRIHPNAMYADLSEDFKEQHPRFKRNGYHSFHELINTGLKWTGSSGSCYMYPWDRDKFYDSKLGMEQKAVFFVMVMQVVLKFMTKTT
ncbi:hypothetical protein VBZ51_08320 [Maribacter sp. HS]|uniref:hypothetical protein n=1 Tax=Maribacter sp. HS TaxID=3110480 RepID=UPI003A8582B5